MMGATESRPESNEANIGKVEMLIAAPRQGYHVIRVAQGSPAYQAGLSVGKCLSSEPFFDFCVGINGKPLPNVGVYATQRNSRPPPETVTWNLVEASEGREMFLNVWNSKQQAYRGRSSN